MKTKQLLLLTLLPLLFIACGSKNQSYSEPQAMIYQDSRTAPTTPYSVMTPRKIATSATISVDVDKMEKAEKELSSFVKNVNGYIENSNFSEDGHYYATIKVPSKKLLESLEAIANLGEKTHQSINKQDVTDSLINNEARLKNLKLFREKMKNLLNKTTKIEDILRIEREINRVQTEIDRIERHLKSTQGSVDMSPISINLKEKTIYGPIGYVGHGLWWAVKKLFIIR